ncbi:MAG: cytidylyltransferase, partial [Acidobacteriota bacterium]|nr:cytidylyltransferase [Acidobacteriota bacterium]
MPEARVIIQCRLSSFRLPGKALLQVAGLPAIVLCASRATNRGGKVLVAISDDPSDDSLSAALERYHVPFSRGPLADVLGRFDLATRNLPDDALVVRLTGDNLVPDEDFVGEMLTVAAEQRLSYLGTDSPLDRLPYGLAAEVFPVKVLREANAAATSSFDREHVTPWIRRHVEPRCFTSKAVDQDFSHLRCTLDDFDDYIRLLALFSRVQDPTKAGWLELVQALAGMPGEPQSRVPFRIRDGVAHSEFTLGTAQLGMPYGIANQQGMPSESDGFAIIRTAVASGVTSADTARGYGEAERRLGLAGAWKDR